MNSSIRKRAGPAEHLVSVLRWLLSHRVRQSLHKEFCFERLNASFQRREPQLGRRADGLDFFRQPHHAILTPCLIQSLSAKIFLFNP